MSDELKACPFCGKSDIHIEQKGTFFWCECYDCGAISREHHTLPGVNVLQSEDIARGYWNQRPLEDALHARIAELEGIVKADNLRLINAGLSAGLYSGCDTAEMMAEEILASRARIAELEEFKKIVNDCGFDVVTDAAILEYPERKILTGHGVIYVPVEGA